MVAVLFAATGTLSVSDLARVTDRPVEEVTEAMHHLMAHPPIGLTLVVNGDLVGLATAPSSAQIIERYLGSPPPVRLSRAALESLAVVAYRQPVTRGEIDAVRGVNSDSAVATLVTRGLVAEVGRRESPGRPALLSTTREFLHYLGVASLDGLPPLAPAARPEPS